MIFGRRNSFPFRHRELYRAAERAGEPRGLMLPLAAPLSERLPCLSCDEQASPEGPGERPALSAAFRR